MDEWAELLGEHPAINVVREKLRQLLDRQQVGRRLPAILIQGETGTGKGLVARLVHRLGPRRGGPFVAINCPAIPETLLEAELFGFEQGAFTDARRAKPGLFQAAHRGTLFLDEVGLLPEPLQAKLLTAIEERVVRRLGSTQPESVDACFVSATNADLQAAVRERRFREDLYHRLAVITLDLPALRDRGRDVLLLAERFLARACVDHGLPPKRMDAQAQNRLLAYSWPGNIRELANVIERAVLFAESPVVTGEMFGSLQAEGPRPAVPAASARAIAITPEDAMRQHLLAVLEQSEGNISRAAARLGIARNTLYARLEKFGVRGHVRDKPPQRLDDMGDQSDKNIARPAQVSAPRHEAVADLPAASVPAEAPRRRRGARRATAAVAAMAFVIAAIAWSLWPATRSSPTPTVASAPAAASLSPPAIAPRLSIVVLPFANLSTDPEQQYFVDGITEDLTTDLSRLAGMVVISRSTAFTYRNKPVNAKQIGRELGVRYVLEGSVRRSGHRVRVNTQLIDAEADRHVWTERFDRDRGDLFRLQDEITRRIAMAVDGEVVRAEAARPTVNPDALDYILRGRAALDKPASRDTYAEIIGLYERALALGPRSAEVQSRLANALLARVLDQMTDSAAADRERAEGLIVQALAASPRSYYPHYAKAQLLRERDRCEEAIPEYETVIALFRNFQSAYAHLGWCKFWTGSIEELIPLHQHAIRLDPHGANDLYYFRIGLAHLVQSRTDQAIVWLEKARSGIPAHALTRASLASAYAIKGEIERAATELAALRRLASDDRYSSIARLKAVGFGYFGVPTVRTLLETTYFAGLRKAGMPEE